MSSVEYRDALEKDPSKEARRYGFVGLLNRVYESAERDNSIDRKRYLMLHEKEIGSFLSRAVDTPYGKSVIDKDAQSIIGTFDNIPALTSRRYGNFVPRDFIRHDITHDPSDMVVLYSGGTSGRPKETYWSKEDAGLTLSPAVEKALTSQPFRFLSESKSTISNKSLMTWATDHGIDLHNFSGFNNAADFFKLCNESEGFIHLTLQVSSIRSLFAEIVKYLKDESLDVDQIVKLNEIYIDLVAEPVSIDELNRWHDTFKELFGVAPKIAVTYSSSENKLIGLYIHNRDDEEIKYKVVDGMIVESIDPKTLQPTEGFGEIVVTNTNKKYGSLYPRYATGDLATISYDAEGSAYISEVGRNPADTQINLHGDKLYMDVFHESIQHELGPDLPVRVQFQKFTTASQDSTLLNIDIGGDHLNDDEIQRVKAAVALLMEDKELGYHFLWNDSIAMTEGIVYAGDGTMIRINFMPTLTWDNQKGFRKLPTGDLETYSTDRARETQAMIVERINALEIPPSHITKEMLDVRTMLVDYALDPSLSAVPKTFFDSDESVLFTEKSRQFNYAFESTDEQELVHLLGTDSGKDIISRVLEKTVNIAVQEIALLNLPAGSTICVVGGGSIPITAINYAQLGMSVTAIDIDEVSVQNGQHFADSLEQPVRVQWSDGLEFDYTNFDAVMIAGMVDDKAAILDRIKEQNPTTKVIVRTPINKRAESLYSPIATRLNSVAQHTLDGNPLKICLY